jgi:magnesium-transporting ATPase (P-type)
MIKGFLWYGMLESVVAMAAYFFINWLYGWPGVPLAGSGTVYDQATTLTLASIVFAQIGMVLNCRTERESIFTVGIFSNRRVIQGIIVELILVVALMYVPFVRSVFQTAPVPLEGWIFLFCIPLPIVLIEEARKYYLRHYSKMEKRS